MKAIALAFVFVMAGVAPALASVVDAKPSCKLPFYVQAVRDSAVPGTTDSAADLFLYGLKSAVSLHQGCIVDRMDDAQLGLFITTLKLPKSEGSDGSSIIAVALAVPLNGISVYMDHYLLVIRDSDSIDVEVNELLESIGETLGRHNSQGN